MKMYLVGGAVRDKLMGRKVNDFDYLVIGATPDQLEARYGQSVGMSFPVFIDNETNAQIAMARRERKTGVGYHGFEVEFGPDVTLAEDLQRRDLTINALAEDLETGEIIDCFGGLDDLKNKVLRHTSHAFAEDPLRVIRLARFAARYPEFSVAPETFELAQQLVDSGEMDALPYERYWLEVEKALDDKNIHTFFSFLNELGAFQKIKFFNEVWGKYDSCLIYNVGKLCTLPGQTKSLSYFAALTAKPGLGKIQAAPNLMLELYTAVRKANSFKISDTDQLYMFARSINAWSQGDFFVHVATALNILNCAGYFTNLYLEDIYEIVRAVRSVTSEPYQHLSGPEIGKAMEKARKEALRISFADIYD